MPSDEEAYRRNFLRRRMQKTVVDPETGCWLWQGARAQGGKYGWTSFHSKSALLHRASYLVLVGPLKAGEQVRHRCDVSHCWNPEHLLKGRQADNEQDKKDRGRFAYNQGEGRYNSKLTEDGVRAIRASGEKHQVLADRHGVARPSIGRIKRREIWAHVA